MQPKTTIRELIDISPEVKLQPWGLLPIFPVYAQRIYTRAKLFEYRKNKPAQDIEVIVLYETLPVSQITGFFLFEDIVQGHPLALWEQTKKHAGIEREAYEQYFQQHQVAYAYAIKKAVQIKSPISLTQIGISAPQTLRYV